MTCLRCQAETRPGRRFCSECGAPLTLACPTCNFSNEPGEKFCGGCGTPLLGIPPLPDARFGSPQTYTPKHLAEKILTTKTALEGERKQVTVLFVDVSGFTALSERLDPEDVHRVMTRAFELMLVEVHRYEGTINQFLGDGIMALFGAPIAHEDHAVRAVHASLGIRMALAAYQGDLPGTRGLTLHVRQGLNTGLVVVGSIGSDLRMDYTAVGDTTNVAARLQQAAHPGQIVLSEATHRLIEGYFDTHSLGELQLKGKADAVQGWEVLSARGARTRFEVRAERGLTPFVSRQRELGMLLERFDLANDGHGQVVHIVGEPGIGKSRLLYELRGRLGEAVTWLEGRCLSFGRSIAFHPLIDLLRRHFGIDESDLEATMLEKIERAVLALGDELRPTLPFLRYLLSLDPGDPAVLSMDPQERRGDLFDALRRLTARGAQARPHVVVYEDLHWIDQATQEYLAFTDDSIPTNRVLRILTYRPGYAHPFGERTYHTRLALTALSTEASVQMAARMLSTRALPEELAALIAQKTDGNPFFVEEVVRSLQETGAITQSGDRCILTRPLTEIFVPDTIQDVIMARIDRLEEAAKRTLQLASVIGRDFSHRLVDQLSDSDGRTRELLRDLTSTELIHEKATLPELGYTFRHGLTHEVAYSSLLIQRRKALHQQIGLAIEELYADRLAEQFAVLAYHFTRAESWAKAHAYLLKAADKAAKAFAAREAIALYEQAETAASRLGDVVSPRTRMAVHQAKADLYLLISAFDRARDEGERVLGLARAVEDHVAEGSALVGMGLASWLGHKFSRALDDARQAIAVAEAVGAPSVLAGGHLVTALVYEMTGRLSEANRTFDQVIRISRQSGDAANESWARVFAAELKGWEARFDEASRLYGDGIRIARTHNVLLPVLEGLFMWGINLTGQGEYDGALALLEEGLALAEKVGDENYTPRYLNSLGWLYTECADLLRARELNRRSLEGGRQRRDDEIIANAELNLADIYLMTGDVPLAQNLLDGVQRHVKKPATSEWMRWRYSIHLFASLADLRLAQGDFAKARGAADECLELATRTNSRKYLVKAWHTRGEIAMARRRWDEAHAAFGEALGIGRRIGAPTPLWKTHFALGRLHAETKAPASASASYQAARGVIDQVMTRLRHSGLRASLQDSPPVRHIRELAERTRQT